MLDLSNAAERVGDLAAAGDEAEEEERERVVGLEGVAVEEAGFEAPRDGGLLEGAEEETALALAYLDALGVEAVAARPGGEGPVDVGAAIAAVGMEGVAVEGVADRCETGGDAGTEEGIATCFVVPTHTGSRDGGTLALTRSAPGTRAVLAVDCTSSVAVGSTSGDKDAGAIGEGALTIGERGEVRSSASNSDSYSSAQSSA